MRIEFLWPGKTKDSRYKELIEDYLLRLSRYTSCQVVEFKTPSGPTGANKNAAAVIAEEGAKILSKIDGGDYVALLDENGRQFSSLELADFLTSRRMDATRRLVFVVGGFAGVSAEVKRRADIHISLSRMTFPHEMARTVLLEQVYRAVTLIEGTPYHKF